MNVIFFLNFYKIIQPLIKIKTKYCSLKFCCHCKKNSWWIHRDSDSRVWLIGAHICPIKCLNNIIPIWRKQSDTLKLELNSSRSPSTAVVDNSKCKTASWQNRSWPEFNVASLQDVPNTLLILSKRRENVNDGSRWIIWFRNYIHTQWK